MPNAVNSKETTGWIHGLDGRALAWREWAPERPPRAVVVIAHGYAEHGGRYANLACDFAGHGFATCAIDHRGHGLSAGKPVSIRRFDEFVDDFETYVTDVRRRYSAPLFVLGHSMGGLIALRYVTSVHPEINGLIVSAAAAKRPDDISGLTVLIGRLLSKVAPDAGIVALPLDRISQDKAVVDAYNADPLVHAKRMNARLGAEILDTIDRVVAALPSLAVPILILHGSEDAISPVESSRFVHATAGSGDNTLKVYDGLWHEIFNEPQRAEVIKDVCEWIDRQLGAGQENRS